MVIKKRGRPKIKYGKNTTFFLSNEAKKKLKVLTEPGRNASAFVEALINSAYNKLNLKVRVDDGQDKRKRLG